MFEHLYWRSSLAGGLSEEDVKLKRGAEPRWSGTVAYRALISKERLDGLRKSAEKEGGGKRMWLTKPVSVCYFLFRFQSELCKGINA